MAKSKRFKVRFHLAKGEHFMHWQITDRETGEVTYHDPKSFLMHLHGCRLHNQPATAQKIFNGEDKTVCAWISCDGLIIAPFGSTGIPEAIEAAWLNCFSRVQYNPKVAPHWRNAEGENIDGQTFGRLSIANRSVFVGS